jgi:HAE1 family hydrophobic/amphiphilic exporter-1
VSTQDRGGAKRALFLLIILTLVLLFYGRGIELGYLPPSAHKTVSVTVEYRGAFEDQIERLVTWPLEEEVSRIPGIKELFSVSEQEKARLYIRFFPETDLDQAYLAVREAVDRLYAALPEGVQRPILGKSDWNSRPVFIAALGAGQRFNEDYIKSQFENVEGAGEVEIGGGSKQEIQIALHADRAAQAAVTINELVTRLRGNNSIGDFGPPGERSHLVDARLANPQALKDLRVSRAITLGELAEIRFTEAPKDSLGRVNGEARIVVYIHKAGDANTITLCRRLSRLIAGLGNAEILYNHGAKMERSLSEIGLAILAGIFFVVLFTLIFLKRVHFALLISLNLPFSILVSIACLKATGHELNLMTLAGIAVGVGMVIDSGVIYLEEFIAVGGQAAEATRRTAPAIVFSTATTLCVFLPLLFAERAFLDLFGGLAVAVGGSILASTVFVFAFLPPLLSVAYRQRGGRSAGSVASSPLPGKDWLTRIYMFIGRFRFVAMLTVAVLAALAVHSLLTLKRESFTVPAESSLSFWIEFPSGRPLDTVVQAAYRMESTLAALPGVSTFLSKYEKERASFDLALGPKAERRLLVQQIKTRAGDIPGGFLYFPDEKVDENDEFEVVVTGPGCRRLRIICSTLAAEVRSRVSRAEIIYHFKEVPPGRLISIDVRQAAALGISPLDLYATLFWSLSGPVAAKWNPPARAGDTGNYADIRLFSSRLQEGSMEEIMDLPVPLSPGSTIHVKNAASVKEEQGTGRIYHRNKQRSLSFSVRVPRERKPEALQAAKRLIDRFAFPEGYRAEAGIEEVETARLTFSALFSLALSTALVFLILIFQFERLSIPAFIFLQIPLSFILPLLLIELIGLPLSLPVIIGLILTAGISVNNSILVFAQLRQGQPTGKAVLEALRRKIRAMLIASLTTVMGVIPLLFTGPLGDGVLAPLSLTISAGVAGSILFLLLTLPGLYRFLPESKLTGT